MTLLELATGVGVVMFTGGLGWWAQYVTSGAAAASRLVAQMDELKRALQDHEENERQKFDDASSEVKGLRGDVSRLLSTIGELHGKLDSLKDFILNGRK